MKEPAQLSGLPLSFIAANTDLWPQRGSGPSAHGCVLPWALGILCGASDNLLPGLCREGAKGDPPLWGLVGARGHSLARGHWEGGSEAEGSPETAQEDMGCGLVGIISWWLLHSSSPCCRHKSLSDMVGVQGIPSPLGQAEALALGHCILGGEGLG